MLPREWSCRLVDLNVSELNQADLEWADMVMTGRMNVQRISCMRVIELAQQQGKPVVVGGQDATSHVFGLAQHDEIGVPIYLGLGRRLPCRQIHSAPGQRHPESDRLPNRLRIPEPQSG